MMQPRFVTKLVKDGETIREFPPVVLKERIAKKETITMMQTILEHVVSQGLGRKAAPLSRAFKVAGKTGTAQIATSMAATTQERRATGCRLPASSRPTTPAIRVSSVCERRVCRHRVAA